MGDVIIGLFHSVLVKVTHEGIKGTHSQETGIPDTNGFSDGG